MQRKTSHPKGRQAAASDLLAVDRYLAGKPVRRDLLIEYLHRIQDDVGHLPAGLLVALAERLRLAPVEVYEVASFYHHFDVVREGEDAPPKLTVRVCDSVGCAMQGAERLLDELTNAVGAGVRIQRVPCVGRCDAAPVVVVGRRPVPHADARRVAAAIDAGSTVPDMPATAVDLATYRRQGGYEALRQLHGEPDADAAAQRVLDLLDDSRLRGLGGAGFPAGRKWRIVRGHAGPSLMAVNIDEGEPGTFKDRYLLELEPHRVLEGMLIAAQVVGVDAIYLYLRDEYAGLHRLLQRELAALQADPPCPLPHIELRRGAGAYICGEESAMIESIEGKRGMPRQRPPYIAERGLFGRPTLEHNVETLYWVPVILASGADWYASQGRRGCRGVRWFSLSGRVRRPGVYAAPAGISARELIDEYGGGMRDGHRFKAYFPGGASGGILPASLGDLPLDFDTLAEHGCFIGSAAVIVLSDQDKVRELARNAMRFFAHESCGQCTPCRVGTVRAADLMAAPVWDQPLLRDLCQVMQDASICGLGQAAPNPLRCVMRYFPEECQ
ncbi:MAG: NAD(P)H-dependent oxidoreductase subunit E [Gammaproteobacteria bacterium]|nr:NAD(P)H-dependent oxidoreductase subunit E [Gammaproteobacteria bacterium]MCP5298551.1 NAD(P)H-dependent oxidoreductase subunit E [Chromatiaceae bacterium]